MMYSDGGKKRHSPSTIRERGSRAGDEREADVREEQTFKCVAIEQSQRQDN